MEHLITNIQRMCMQDGPGIRTTVFMKGCGIHCPWCSNPENIAFGKEEYVKSGVKGIYGRPYSIEELYQELIKDKDYWISGGGVTFSGGEALLHMDYLQGIMCRLREEHIHLAVETALFIPGEMLQTALEYIDFFYVDIKLLDPEQCRMILGGSSAQYCRNVETIAHSGKKVCFRIPCAEQYTLSDNNKELLLRFLKGYQEIPIEIFKIHKMGEAKYQSLGKKMPENVNCTDAVFMEFFNRLRLQGNHVSIIQL